MKKLLLITAIAITAISTTARAQAPHVENALESRNELRTMNSAPASRTPNVDFEVSDKFFSDYAKVKVNGTERELDLTVVRQYSDDEVGFRFSTSYDIRAQVQNDDEASTTYIIKLCRHDDTVALATRYLTVKKIQNPKKDWQQ